MIKHLTPRTAKEIKQSLRKDKWHLYRSNLNLGKIALPAFCILLLSFIIFLDIVVFKENHSNFITGFIVQKEIIELAEAKLPIDHKKVYANFCCIYVMGNEVGDIRLKNYAYNSIYKVTFSRRGFLDKWRFFSMEKTPNDYMSKTWFSTQLTSEKENIKRPYD